MKRALRLARLGLGGALALLLMSELGVGLYAALAPYPAERLDRYPASVRLLDEDGDLLREAVGRSGARAQWTPLERISPLLVEATVATEDRRFYDHRGVDPRSVARAAAQNLAAGRVVSGASTLTMQLVRLLVPHERTFAGKLGEMVDARRLEAAVDKEALLEQYLNRAPYGAGALGAEAASLRYFGKPSRNLSLGEAALLAGLPKAPSALNPFTSPERALARREVVLDALARAGTVEPERIARARREPLALVEPETRPQAMHFTDWVLGSGERTGEVRTTLDGGLQESAQALVREHVERMAGRGASDAAAVVLDSETCAVKAMVGSADYWASGSGSVNGALALRQPGSTLKPFTYGLAFEQGFTPVSIAADVPTRYGEADGELFFPQNYTKSYSGPVLLREALGRSLNVPAIRVAASLGAEPLLARLRRAGFSSLDQPAEHYGLGLTLGNGEVTLLELAQAYAALARGGRPCRATPFLDEGRPDAGGEPRVFDEEIAWLVGEILRDEGLRRRAFGAYNALLLGFPVAVKTGTSSNWRDSWAVGFAGRVTVAVWTGDFEGRPMNQVPGATGAGPLFARLMSAAVEGARVEAPPPPGGLVQVEVCSLSGRRPSARCPHTTLAMVREESLRDGGVEEEACPWHRAVRIDARNGLRAGPGCEGEHVEERVYPVLPPAYAEWHAESGLARAPRRYSPLCPASGEVPDALVITYPRDGEAFVIEPGYDRASQTVPLQAHVDPPVGEVTWRVDGRPVARAGWPYKAEWRLAPGTHRLEVEAGGRRSPPVSFRVR